MGSAGQGSRGRCGLPRRSGHRHRSLAVEHPRPGALGSRLNLRTVIYWLCLRIFKARSLGPAARELSDDDDSAASVNRSGLLVLDSAPVDLQGAAWAPQKKLESWACCNPLDGFI
mmetsp:Transcript_155036/g.496989  ORF Transcript_155036/g.496989 Transcript_155036/m.496989 type:complete len:115 (-) Transcript_155036:680-1024(-)